MALAKLASLLVLAAPATASYAFYVGKNLTADGSVMVGGTGEEVSSHWLQLFPARDHAPNETIRVGVTESASIPGQLIEIPQVPHTLRYLSMEYSDYEGFPAPLTNGGLNEKGVAVRDVFADNRADLVAMTPKPQHGVQYSDLARIVMERASTAREGVQIIGDLIHKFNYATYGGNTHLIADKDEGWIVWEFAGGKRLWAAQRLRPDEVRVLYPGYIEDFPVNFQNSPDYMGSPNLVSFAIDQGWWDPHGDAPFNIFNIYGPQDGNHTARDGGYKYISQAALENATLSMAPVTETDLMKRVRDPRIADDHAGYGQVVSLSGNTTDPDLLRIWIAPTGSVAAPFIPWYIGVESIPPEFGEHRYLTAGSSSTFLNPDYAMQEASLFAGRMFKRVMYYMCSDPKSLFSIVTEMLTSFEAESRAEVFSWVEKAAAALLHRGQRKEARELLTYYSHSRAEKALDLATRMTGALDGYLKLSGKWHTPNGTQINNPDGAAPVTCLVGINPDKPANEQHISDQAWIPGM